MYKHKCNIDGTQNCYLERLQFECNSILKIISYLGTSKIKSEEHIKYYTELFVSKNTELEMAATTAAQVYGNLPKDKSLKNFKYNYETFELEYNIEEEDA